jgi:RNA polymerase sigma factor (sigma-70 family)
MTAQASISKSESDHGATGELTWWRLGLEGRSELGETTNLAPMIERAQDGDIEAMEWVLRSQIGMVIFAAAAAYKKRPHHSLEFEDLVHAGVIGMMQAVRKYEPRNKRSFDHLAWTYMRREISEAYRKDKPLKLPKDSTQKVWRAIKAIWREREESGEGMGEPITADQVMEHSKVTARTVKPLLAAMKMAFSVDAIRESKDSVYDDSGLVETDVGQVTWARGIRRPTEEAALSHIYHAQLKEQVEQAMEMLVEPDDEEIARRKLGLDGEEPASGADIGKDLGITRAYVNKRFRHIRKVLQSYLSDITDTYFKRHIFLGSPGRFDADILTKELRDALSELTQGVNGNQRSLLHVETNPDGSNVMITVPDCCERAALEAVIDDHDPVARRYAMWLDARSREAAGFLQTIDLDLIVTRAREAETLDELKPEIDRLIQAVRSMSIVQEHTQSQLAGYAPRDEQGAAVPWSEKAVA